MNFENGGLHVRRTIGTGDLWSGGTARRSSRTVASMRMVMHSHWLSAGLSVPGRIGVIAVDAAGESHNSSLQKCKRNHDCDRPANDHKVIVSGAAQIFNLPGSERSGGPRPLTDRRQIASLRLRI